jgi:hypothetical protein
MWRRWLQHQGPQMVVVAKKSANSAAAAPTQSLSRPFGVNVRNAKQPDITATKNARTAKVLATYSSSSGTRQRFETPAHFHTNRPRRKKAAPGISEPRNEFAHIERIEIRQTP